MIIRKHHNEISKAHKVTRSRAFFPKRCRRPCQPAPRSAVDISFHLNPKHEQAHKFDMRTVHGRKSSRRLTATHSTTEAVLGRQGRRRRGRGRRDRGFPSDKSPPEPWPGPQGTRGQKSDFGSYRLACLPRTRLVYLGVCPFRFRLICLYACLPACLPEHLCPAYRPAFVPVRPTQRFYPSCLVCLLGVLSAVHGAVGTLSSVRGRVIYLVVDGGGVDDRHQHSPDNVRGVDDLGAEVVSHL